MIRIFGHPASTCTRKVLFTLHETNTPYELVVVDFAKGEHKQEPHLSRQPFGKIPALDDDGFALYESRAMARYLDGKSGGALTPTDLKQRAYLQARADAGGVGKRGEGPRARVQRPRQEPGERDVLVGDKLTLADVTYAPYFEYAMATPAKEIFAKYPHVVAWWNRVSERPAWRKVVGR
jgi:glutathione S-transferase